MAILDFQLQWHWVGVLQMESSYSVMELQREVWKQNSTKDYNNRTDYECFKNTFPDGCGTPDLNLPPITIDDRHRPHKWARYTTDLLPAAIYVASESHVSTLTIPSDTPQLLVLTSDDP